MLAGLGHCPQQPTRREQGRLVLQAIPTLAQAHMLAKVKVVHSHLAAKYPDDELRQLALTHDDAGARNRLNACAAQGVLDFLFAQRNLGVNSAQSCLHAKRIILGKTGIIC